MQFADQITVNQEMSAPVASLERFLVIAESAQEHAPRFSASVLDSRSSFEELTDVIRQLHQEPSRIIKHASKKNKIQTKPRSKDKAKAAPSIAYGHKLRQIRNAQHLQSVYTGVDIYELHYGGASPKRISTDEEDYQSNPRITVKQDQPLEEENPEKMNQTIQHIINAKLFGALSDISADEKERFRNWREFHKHLRRLYEGAHYWTSITKFV